jgi:hypothetical protein
MTVIRDSAHHESVDVTRASRRPKVPTFVA